VAQGQVFLAVFWLSSVGTVQSPLHNYVHPGAWQEWASGAVAPGSKNEYFKSRNLFPALYRFYITELNLRKFNKCDFTKLVTSAGGWRLSLLVPSTKKPNYVTVSIYMLLYLKDKQQSFVGLKKS
jgi:hypothetical protein